MQEETLDILKNNFSGRRIQFFSPDSESSCQGGLEAPYRDSLGTEELLLTCHPGYLYNVKKPSSCSKKL
jgi:hypothetical protein